MERYTDKIVMITGAGDVALAIAERMLGEGARIAFTDFSATCAARMPVTLLLPQLQPDGAGLTQWLPLPALSGICLSTR